MKILKDDSIAIIVDIQEKLMPHIHNNEEILSNCVKLVSGLNSLDIPILLLEQYPKGLGHTVENIKSVLKTYEPIEKLEFNCCDNENILNILKESKKKNVILMGVESHVCLLQSALGLKEHGFQPVIIQDCVSSRNPNDKKFAIKRLIQENCIISTYESILFEFCQKAGNDYFKAISKIVK